MWNRPTNPAVEGLEAEAVADEFVTAVLMASRTLVGVAARSFAAVESEVTLQQYRALVVLAEHGDQRISGMSEALAIHASTTSRLCDRLVVKDLIVRTPSTESRREVIVGLTPAGRRLVDSVTQRRRAEIAAIAGRVSEPDRRGFLAALESFSETAGELPDDAWRLGWS